MTDEIYVALSDCPDKARGDVVSKTRLLAELAHSHHFGWRYKSNQVSVVFISFVQTLNA